MQQKFHLVHEKKVRVVKNFKIVKGSCSLNRYYRVSCNYCYEVVPGMPKYKANKLELFSADSIVSDKEGQS